MTGKIAGEKRLGDRCRGMDRDTMRRFPEQRTEVGSVSREEGAALQSNGGSQNRPVPFGNREACGHDRIDDVARCDAQMP